AICHPAWRGIRAATYGQAAHILEVPGITSAEHCERLLHFLESCDVQQVVINGFPPRIDEFVTAIARDLPHVAVYFIYHGTPAQFHFKEDSVVQRMLELVDAGAVRKLGFVKSGLAEFIRNLGYPAEYVMNACRLPLRQPRLDLAPGGKLN